MKNKGGKSKFKRKGSTGGFGCDLTEYLESSGQDEEAESDTLCSSEKQLESEKETVKSNDLHYATIDFGFTESKKIHSAVDTTTYAIIKTDHEDCDAYDYVLVN